MSVCIFLFCTLETLVAAISWNLKSASASRLITRHSVSLVFTLPQAYKARLAHIPGVRSVAGYSWLQALNWARPPTPKKFFPNFAIQADDYLPMNPEYILTEEDKKAFLADRRGCIVGPDLVEKFGWKLGDIVQLTSMIPTYKTGKPFEFVIRAIYHVDEARHPGTPGSVLSHDQYLDEAVGGRAGISMYKLLIDDPSQAGATTKRSTTSSRTPIRPPGRRRKPRSARASSPWPETWRSSSGASGWRSASPSFS